MQLETDLEAEKGVDESERRTLHHKYGVIDYLVLSIEGGVDCCAVDLRPTQVFHRLPIVVMHRSVSVPLAPRECRVLRKLR